MESSFSSFFTPTLKKIAVVNYPAHSPLLPRAVETVGTGGKLPPPPTYSADGTVGTGGTIDPPRFSPLPPPLLSGVPS